MSDEDILAFMVRRHNMVIPVSRLSDEAREALLRSFNESREAMRDYLAEREKEGE